MLTPLPDEKGSRDSPLTPLWAALAIYNTVGLSYQLSAFFPHVGGQVGMPAILSPLWLSSKAVGYGAFRAIMGELHALAGRNGPSVPGRPFSRISWVVMAADMLVSYGVSKARTAIHAYISQSKLAEVEGEDERSQKLVRN